MLRPSRPPQESSPELPASKKIKTVPPLPLVEQLAQRLDRLADALDLGSDCRADVRDVFRHVVVPWSRLGLDTGSRDRAWFSEISDDNTPVEFSITLSPEGSEVRVLFEPQGEEQSLASHRAAALAMHEMLAADYGADLTRFDRVRDLFLPSEISGPFALWSAVVFARGKPPSFKAYFNPQSRGASRAPALVEEALRRLGMPRAWSHVTACMTCRGPHLDELKYFALDLSEAPLSRVKVYVRHHDSTPADLEHSARSAGESRPGEVARFARAVSGDAERFTRRATFSCAAFVEGSDSAPAATTHYIPVCAYAENDAVVEARVSKFLEEVGLEVAPYRRMLHSFANRPLDAGVGMQSWVALRRWDDVPRLTVYLGSESRTVFPTGSVPASTNEHLAFASAADIINCVTRYRLPDHPLIRRIAETRDAALLWLLIYNTYQGTSVKFAAWLASVTATVQDERARSLLARQLNEEMGDGHVERAHARLMTSFLEAIGPLRPAELSDSLLEPGLRLRERLEALYRSSDQYVALATLMAGEICAHQLIAAVAKLLEPHMHRVDASQLTWLTHHNEVEGGHADESLELAGFVPNQHTALDATSRGAFGLHTALWQSMDELLARIPAV